MNHAAPVVKGPSHDTGLGRFLLGRRALVTPESVGLPGTGHRRVNGLRREEVALLAGVSANYYTRLEQGRERRPSLAVLSGLARVLGLNKGEQEHLFRLAGFFPNGSVNQPTTEVTPELLDLLGQLNESPALVISYSLDVLARNELAMLLHSGFSLNANAAQMCFLDPAGRTFYEPWSEAATDVVAELRSATAQWPDDPRLGVLIEELRSQSNEFETLWESQTVGVKRNETKGFVHPDAGLLSLDYQSFDVRGVVGQQLVVFTSAGGTESCARLASVRGPRLTRPDRE